MRKRVDTLIVLSALVLGALPVSSQDRDTESAAHKQVTLTALVAEGYRVIARDQVGFGKSSLSYS